MFIVGKSFFSQILSTFNIQTIAPLCVIHISVNVLSEVPSRMNHTQGHVDTIARLEAYRVLKYLNLALKTIFLV